MNLEENSHSDHFYTGSICLLPASSDLSTLTIFFLFVKAIEEDSLAIDQARQEHDFNAFKVLINNINCITYFTLHNFI